MFAIKTKNIFTNVLVIFLLSSIFPCIAETTKTTVKHHSPSAPVHHAKKIKHQSAKKKNRHQPVLKKHSTKKIKKPQAKLHHNHAVSTASNPVQPQSTKHQIVASEPAYLHKNRPIQFAPSPGIVAAMGKRMVDFVHDTVTTLRYSVYQFGGGRFDAERGVYVLDCSHYVDHILQSVHPHAYLSLIHSSRTDSPASQHYYHFFKELSAESDSYWNKIDEVDQLRPGDILVFRYKNARGLQTGGHVMVVMDQPIRDTDVYYVRVADSAPAAHSQDTRQPHYSGIGIGTLLLRANPKTGKPSAYAWGIGGYWNRNVSFAMARPIDMLPGQYT